MQGFLNSLIMLIIGGSLIGLIAPNEKLGKGVKFTVSLFITIGILCAFFGMADQTDFVLPDKIELDVSEPYTESVRLCVAAEVKKQVYLYSGVYPDVVNVQCEYADNTVNVTEVKIQIPSKKDGLLEHVKKNCGLDCVYYEE